MIALSMESSVGNRGQQKAPLVLSAPEVSESEVDLMEEAVKDFKRVSVQYRGEPISRLFFCTSLSADPCTSFDRVSRKNYGEIQSRFMKGRKKRFCDRKKAPRRISLGNWCLLFIAQ